MKTLLLLFALILLPVLSWARWEWWKASPQLLENTHPDFIIAVGEEDKLLEVPAHLINKALQEDKEIRMRYVRVKGDIKFQGALKQEIYFLDTVFSGKVDLDLVLFNKSVSFKNATFLKKANFSGALFQESAYFNKSAFLEDVFFTGSEFFREAYFAQNRFMKKADFWRVVFSDNIFFQESKFLADTYFREIHFIGQATFSKSQFFGKVFFEGSKFSKDAVFTGAAFFEQVDFSDILFTRKAFFQEVGFFRKAKFIRAKFLGKTDFKETVFDDAIHFRESNFEGDLSFKNVTFEKYANFLECLFPIEENALSFSGVTGFSSMLIDWYTVKDNKKSIGTQRLGISNSIQYDKTFFLALMKNYQDLGQWSKADAVGFMYRQKENRKSVFYQRLPEQIFLEWTFGYGFKPWRLALTFSLFWFLFGVYYTFWIKNNRGDSIWKSRNYKQKFRFISWAFFHSLNVQIPEISLDSLEHPFLKKSYHFQKNRLAIIHAHYVQAFIGWYLLILFLIMFSSLWVR